MFKLNMERKMVGINYELLSKVWKLVKSGVGGEAEAAKNRAERIVKPFGYTLADIPSLLLEKDKPPPFTQSGFAFYDINNKEHMREFHAKRKAEDKVWINQHKQEIEEILAKYGSIKAVFEPTREEIALKKAGAPFYKKKTYKDGRYEESWDGKGMYDTWPERCMQAIKDALPQPKTIPEAIKEYRFWRNLMHEREIIYRFEFPGSGGEGNFISGECFKRECFVEDLIRKHLSAQTHEEIITRIKFLIEIQDFGYEELESIERDVTFQQKKYASFNLNNYKNETNPVFKSASQRRKEVEELLKSLQGKSVSLRSIAKQVGVSPATVLNIKRRLGI